VIISDLSCEQEHCFEAWFASSEALDAQLGKAQVACPICGSTHIKRLPAAPALTRGRDKPADAQESPKEIAKRVVESLRTLAATAEDVGPRFADEARKIHRGETKERRIRGRASQDEVSELLDEGIDILPVPPDPTRLH
jgi:hypothetical protein